MSAISGFSPTLMPEASENSDLYSITFENVNTRINGNLVCEFICLTDPNKREGFITDYFKKKGKETLYYGGLSKILIPERDGTSFIHSNREIGDGFYGISDYKIQNKNLQKLIKGVSFKTDDKAISNVYRYYQDQVWSGSCYGIASSMAIEFNKDILEGDYYSQHHPFEDNYFRDVIQFLHMTQHINLKDAYYCYSKDKKQTQHYAHNYQHKLTDVMKHIVEVVRDNPSKAFILGIPGHCVTIQGMSQDNEGNYHLRLYDCNSSIITDLVISSDYKKLTLVEGSAKGTESNEKKSFTENNIDYLGLIDPDVLYAYLLSSGNDYTGDDKINIVYRDELNFTIKRGDQQPVIIYDEMPIISTSNADLTLGERIRCTVDPGIYEVTSLSDTSDMMLYDNLGKSFMTFAGEHIESASVDSVNNVLVLSGTDMDFKVFIGTDTKISSDENGLVSIRGNTSGSVTFSAQNGTVIMRATETITKLQITSYYGNDHISSYPEDTSILTFTVNDDGTTDLPIPQQVGDVTGDGVINAKDAAEVLIAAAKIGTGNPTGLNAEKETAADVNGDGIINAMDASTILRYAAAVGIGKISRITDYI